MASMNIKDALLEDVQTLKRLDLEIMPAGKYYRRLFLGWLILFSLFLGTQLMACITAIHNGAWSGVSRLQAAQESVKFYDKQHYLLNKPIDEEWDLKREHPNATPEEIDAMVKKNEKEYEAAYRKRTHDRDAKNAEELSDERLKKLIKMVLGIFFSSLFFSLFFIGKMKNYIIFKYQIQPRLRTGEYLAKKAKMAFYGFFILFGLFSFLLIPLFEQDVTFFTAIPCLIGAAMMVGLFINMEASRLGVSLLSSAMMEFFQKGKGKINVRY